MSALLDTVNRLTPASFKPLQAWLYWRVKNVQPNVRALRTWRGESPRIYLHNNHPHPVFATYISHPALAYAPYPVAQLCHWVDGLPQRRSQQKQHIFEAEHLMIFAKPDNKNFMTDWHRLVEDLAFVRGIIAQENTRKVFTFSAGLVEHFKTFLPSDLWSKLDYAYPAFPVQPEYKKVENDAFTILLIASRFSDKGVPEALRAFEILRQRHGQKVCMNLVCQTVPDNYALPDGVQHFNVPWLTPELKTRLYQTADVLFLPCYSETAACFTEAYAFGVPVITTRIHHGDEYVRESQTGFLLDAPLFIYSEGFGRRWKTTWEFLEDVQARRERGDLEIVVEQAVDRLETMINGAVNLPAMRQAALAFHAERFSPEARNRKLHAIYQSALEMP